MGRYPWKKIKNLYNSFDKGAGNAISRLLGNTKSKKFPGLHPWTPLWGLTVPPKPPSWFYSLRAFWVLRSSQLATLVLLAMLAFSPEIALEFGQNYPWKPLENGRSKLLATLFNQTVVYLRYGKYVCLRNARSPLFSLYWSPFGPFFWEKVGPFWSPLGTFFLGDQNCLHCRSFAKHYGRDKLGASNWMWTTCILGHFSEVIIHWIARN